MLEYVMLVGFYKTSDKKRNEEISKGTIWSLRYIRLSIDKELFLIKRNIIQ